MLSCGELCACKILEAFHITQPTLSHDMKVLIEAKIVNDRRDGKNIYYSLNKEQLNVFEKTIHEILTEKSDCICKADGCCNQHDTDVMNYGIWNIQTSVFIT